MWLTSEFTGVSESRAWDKILGRLNHRCNASDNFGVVKVEFYVGATLTCTDTVAPYTCAWQVPNPKANFS